MNLRAVIAGLACVFVWGVPGAPAQVTVNLTPGNFNYQFADHTTGAPITNLSISALGAAGKKAVDVYLIQTGGSITYTNPQTNQPVTTTHILNDVGAEGLGVRLLYNAPTGVLQVPNTGGTTAQQQSTINANITANPNFDLTTKNGSTASPPYGSSANQVTDTTTNAQTTVSLVSNPLVFPGPEDPAGNVARILVGTFQLQAVAPGSETIQAVDPFAVGNQNLTGPIPPTDSLGNPNPPDGFHGEIQLDQFLAQNIGGPYANLNAATLTVNAVPEPGTLALGAIAAVGFVGWRRWRLKTAVPASDGN
jgi:hypothetical protein